MKQAHHDDRYADARLAELLAQVHTYLCHVYAGKKPDDDPEQAERFAELFPAFSRFYLDGGVLVMPYQEHVTLDSFRWPDASQKEP